MEEKEQLYCQKCCREITEEEAEQYEGYCRKCYTLEKQYREEDNDKMKNGENRVATIIKVISIIGAIIGVCFGFSQFDSYKSEGMGVTIIVASVVSAIFVYALGEIIQLLEDIKNKGEVKKWVMMKYH